MRSIQLKQKHTSVLLYEAVNGLNIRANGIYIDGTFGQGGHSKLILSRLKKKGRLIALDRDPYAVAVAQQIINDSRFSIKSGSFSKLQTFVEEEELVGKIDGILLDFGISSLQLDDPSRGFSFTHDGPLDMRIDPTSGQSATEWLMKAKEKDISMVLKKYGEERLARRIAKAIISRNHHATKAPLTRTKQLADLIEQVSHNHNSNRRRNKSKPKHRHRHPATKSFLAIRIYINNELEEITIALNDALNILAPHGRLSIISFHSLEDRLVKHFISKHSHRVPQLPSKLPLTDLQLKNLLGNPVLKALGKLKPTAKEVMENPRSRSSILRFAEMLR